MTFEGSTLPSMVEYAVATNMVGLMLVGATGFAAGMVSHCLLIVASGSSLFVHCLLVFDCLG